MMRRAVVVGLSIVGLLVLPGRVGAQVRDSTVRGVMAARPDTLPARAIAVRLEAGLVLAHQIYGSPEAEIAAGLGGVVRGAVEYRWNRGFGTFAMLGGSIVSADESMGGTRLASGSATQFDVMAGLSWQPPIRERTPEPVTLHVAGGGAWISVPSPDATDLPGDPGPPSTRIREEDKPFPAWEVGLTIRPTRRALSGSAVLQTTRVLPSSADEDVWTQRLLIMLRLGT